MQWKRVLGRRRPEAPGSPASDVVDTPSAATDRPRAGAETEHPDEAAGPPDDPDDVGYAISSEFVDEPAPWEPPTVQDLARLAGEATWSESRPHFEALRVVEEAVSRRPDGRVLVTGATDVDAWASVLEQAWPELTVQRVRFDDDPSEVHVRLTVAGPFDVVIDASDLSGTEQARLFQRTFMHLDQGGSYIARRLVPTPGTPCSSDASTGTTAAGVPAAAPAVDALPNENIPEEPPYEGDLWSLVAEAQAARTRDLVDDLSRGWERRDVFGLAGCLAEVHVHSKALRLVNGTRVSAKLREEEVDAVLAVRPELGERLASLPPVTWSAANEYVVNRAVDPYVQAEFRVPEMVLRRYDDAVCSRGQVVTRDHLLYPETFRQNWMTRMANIYVVEKYPRFGVVRRDLRDPDALAGAWFHLDSEWPGHFGHLLTEQVSRLWAFEQVREREPDVKVLLTLQHDRDPMALQPFESDVLGAFGITPEDVHVFANPCRPERLYTATGMFSLPRFVHPDVAALWDRVGDHLVRDAEERPRAERLFVSRKPSLKRSCHNVAAVEEIFTARGFEILHPEDHSLAEQVSRFRAAHTVAGFAGSGLFSLMFCREPKDVVVLGPDAYTARNENLIAAVRGHRVTAVRSRSDVEHPEGWWTQQAFASGFTFDVDDEGRFLAEQLDRIEARRG
ncbi:glycosyltransferase family 61 protein [Intrasporangium sp. YIM S08009]|uniref:glycosyltransferase family 61 protein n=1 Tax=Intrasporangium zincisolvens TaxID=3080018 RepID=UPI002B05A041|nr:glycosyltransferase family 61 protein [Intrasporangium sp. YIM S08009]